MENDSVNRRSFLQAMGSAGLLSTLPSSAFAAAMDGKAVYEVAAADPAPAPVAKNKIRFSVIGVDHYHIMGMTAAVIRGGGELVSVYATAPKQIADFQKQFPQAKLARSEEEILNDPSIQLVAGAPIPDQRTPLGIRVMRHGKDYLSDKPAVTTLEQLDEVRHVIAETKRIFAIMYSERLEVRAAVKAGELIQQGAIGRVVQTVNLAPHQTNPASRPDWFWDKKRYGGILCDIGSHQADQFVYYTNSKRAEVTHSQVANVAHDMYPNFEDFGDMTMVGDGGLGYVRVDWFTPQGLGVWGDGRLFVLGTEGYIELRKYVDVLGHPGGNHLFIVDQKQARYIDCKDVELPFGPQFVDDILNRTQVGQNQAQALLATELVLKAQKAAKLLFLKQDPYYGERPPE